MPDISQTIATLIAEFADNNTGNITAQFGRNLIKTMEMRSGNNLIVRATDTEYGAVGDGVTDNKSAIQAAINTNAAYILIDQPGTYMISDYITWNADGQTLVCGPGVIIKLTSGTKSGACFYWANNNCAIYGGTWDGNSGNITTSNNSADIIWFPATGTLHTGGTVSGCTIQNAQQGGLGSNVNTGGSDHQNVTVQNCYFKGQFGTDCMDWCNNANHVDHMRVYDCVFDRTACANDDSSVTNQCLYIKGPCVDASVERCVMWMRSTAEGLCVTIGNGSPTTDVRVVGNYVTGSGWGMSIDTCTKATITGNNVYMPSGTSGGSFGIECPAANDYTIAGNTVDGNNYNTGNGAYGIALNGAGGANNTIVGNNIRNCAIGLAIGDGNTSHQYTNTVITGNNFSWSTALSGATAININMGSDFVISGNMLDGNSNASSHYGIHWSGGSNVNISGNTIKNFPNGLDVSSSWASTTDHVNIDNNVFISCTTPFPAYSSGNFTGSSTVGAHVRARGNEGLAANGNATYYDYIDWLDNVIDAWGTGSPASSVTAGVGSRYMNFSGGSGTTLYVKESGTGNTGWTGK